MSAKAEMKEIYEILTDIREDFISKINRTKYETGTMENDYVQEIFSSISHCRMRNFQFNHPCYSSEMQSGVFADMR